MTSEDWYNPDQTKKLLPCIMGGCKPCMTQRYCKEHDKVARDNAPSIPLHCKECGEYIMDEKRDTKGMFG